MTSTLQVSQDESDTFTPGEMSRSNADRSSGRYNPFGTLRRSLREANPFKNGIFRLPATPRLTRSRKVMGNCEGSTGWNFERGQVRPPSTPQLDRVAVDLSATTASSRSGSSRESDLIAPLPVTGHPTSASVATPKQRSMANKNVADLPPPPPTTSTSARRPLPFGIGRRYEPPSPEEAQEDIYAHIQSLLSPSPSPALSGGGRRFLFPTTKYDQRSGEMTAASWISHGSNETNRQPARALASQESLMSLMSSSGGTSGFCASNSPLSPRAPKKSMRSGSSGSSRGSYGDLHNKKLSHGTSSRRSYPLNGLFPAAKSVAASSQRSFGIGPSPPTLPPPLPDGLTIRPQFNLASVTVPSEFDTPFLGREWIYRDVHEALVRSSTDGTRAMLIHGAAGSGKSAVVRQLILNSPFYGHDDFDGRGSLDSGFVNGSRLSLASQSAAGAGGPIFQSRNYEWLRAVASRVVAYHCCRVESGPTCSVPEFISNLAATLAAAPMLRSYAELLTNDPELQPLVTLATCIKSDPATVFRRAICAPLHALKAPDNGTLLLVIDAIDEAEFHRPENGESIGEFLAAHVSQLPGWLRLVITCRTENTDVLESMGARRLALDDAMLDERVWRDCRLYVDYRLATSAQLQQNVSTTTGVPEGDDPSSHFGSHIVGLAKGNMLYLRLVLDLLESDRLRLKSANYSVLPVNLAEVFLLMFNLKFSTVRAFERIASVLSVMLASLRPIDLNTMSQTINAGLTDDYIPIDDIRDRLAQLIDFVVEMPDGSFVPVHPSFRDWLMRRQDGSNFKFFADIRQGHMLLALWLSRRGNLKADDMLELGHHLLKAHPYKHLRPMVDSVASNGVIAPPTAVSGRDCQLVWIQQSAKDLNRALCSDRNVTFPNTKVSRLLLLAGASPDAALDDGQPMLCRAAMAGQSDFCALLIEFDANVDVVEPSKSRSPLMLAAACGHLDVVQILHQHGASLSKTDADEKCALVHAAESGHVSIVSFLLECVWSATGDTNRTMAIHRSFVLAAASGRTKVCEYLLDCADVSVETTDPVSGITALCAACSSAHSETVHFFLSRGAQIGATRLQKPPTTEQLTGNSPLICAVASGSWDLVVSLLTRGLDVNEERTVDGFTPLMAAAYNGHIGVMELLLSRGASLDAVDTKGRTALAHACFRGHTSCASLLMDRGARVDLVDRDGNAVLHLAASKGNRSLVSRLLEHGAKLEEEDGSGMRPIDVAVKHENTSALQCFLRRGAKLGGTTWDLAKNAPLIALMLLQKLIEDGNLLYRRGRIKEAAHRFNYALRKCATMVSNVNMESHRKKLGELNCALLLGLSRTKRRLGEFDGAVECCSEALQLATGDESRFEAHFLRAKCHFDAQDLDHARRDAQTAVQLRPTSNDARQLLQTLTMPTVLSMDAHRQQQPSTSDLLEVATTVAVHGTEESQADAHVKSVSPADCSSDSGNQADYEDHHLLSPGRQSLDESEL